MIQYDTVNICKYQQILNMEPNWRHYTPIQNQMESMGMNCVGIIVLYIALHLAM